MLDHTRETHRLLRRVKSPEPRVDVWQAHLDSASISEIEELRELLDAAEIERANRFHFERDRARFIVAHGLLRHLLSRALGRAEVAFNSGANGKPALVSNENLHFNLSHSADKAVFALAWNRQVGIDLESAESLMRNPTDLPAMAERIFSTNELAHWRGIPDEETRIAAFLRAWTRKEACLKAAGLNLNEMAEIAVGFAIGEPLEIAFPPSGDKSRRCAVHDLAVPSPFACALAIDAVD